MSLQPCRKCGTGFDIAFVQPNPFKRCPNPACGAPLDADAVEHTFVEAGNPSDKNDAQRAAARDQLHADVAAHTGLQTETREALAAKASKDS